MESAISTFCQTLSSFCRHVETTSKSLSDSVQHRPLPLDSAASAFLQCVGRRVDSTAADVDLLESMAFGTVSFEELLGHCSVAFENNQKYIAALEERMRTFGYVPEIELEDDVEEDSKFASPINGVGNSTLDCGSVSVLRSSRKIMEDDSLFEDSVSLKKLGLSDACLATLASQGDDYLATPERSSNQVLSFGDDQLSRGVTSLSLGHVSKLSELEKHDIPRDVSSTRDLIKPVHDDYDRLPSYLKNLASWEELQKAVSTMNNYLSEMDGAEENYAFDQDSLEAMGMGSKGRSYLLLLLRMNQLVVETIDGSVVYKVRAD